MPTHVFVVMTRAVPGQERAFHDWYDDRHLADCLQLPEVVSARRFEVTQGLDEAAQPAAAPFDSLALYEIESDDPAAVIRALAARAGTPVMALTPAFDRSGTVRALARPAGVRTR